MISNHTSLSLLLVTITALVGSLFGLFSKPSSKPKITWGVFNLIVTMWAVLLYTSTQNIPSYHKALFYARSSQIFATLIPIVFFHFTCIVLNIEKTKKKPLFIFYLLSATLIIFQTLFPKEFVASLRPILDIHYYIKAGHFYFLIPLFYAITISYSLFLILSQYPNANVIRKNQLKYLFVAYTLGACGGFTGFLLTFDIPIQMYGYYLVIFNILIVFYAIGKHQLLDIKIAFSKSLVYTLLVSSLSIIYFCIIFLTENIFKQTFGYKSLPVSLLLICIISILFIPLKNIIQNLIDKLLYKGSLDEITQRMDLLEREMVDKEKFKAISTLASGMAHEIKNPLTAIKTFSEYLPQKSSDPEFLNKFSKIVGAEVDRIDDIVNQLLTFSKPAPLEKKDTHLHKLIDETIDFLSSQLIEKHIDIRRYYDANLKTLRLDPNKIRQVLLNLFLNAIDAMPEGGSITITTTLKNNTATISIADTGIGIPKDKLKNVFDPFFTQKDHGTGLGLSISKSIIEDHQGKIGVSSNTENGTQFIIELSNKAGD